MSKEIRGQSKNQHELTAALALTNIGIKDGNRNSVEAMDESTQGYDAKIFPQKLFDILSDERNSDSITWLEHGRGFLITDRKKFATEVLPRYFKKTKYTSFTRKMNRWSFSRVTRGPEIGAYYHKYFRRGEPMLCTQMYCKNERTKFAICPSVANAPSATSFPCSPLPPPPSTCALMPPIRPQQQQAQAPQQIPTSDRAALSPKLATAKLPIADMTQRHKMLLAMSQTQKANAQMFGVPPPTSTAVINAALQALYRSNAMEASAAVPAAAGIAKTPLSVSATQGTMPRSTFAPRCTFYRASAA